MDNYNYQLKLDPSVQDYEASASSKPVNLELIFSNDHVIVSPVFTKQNISGHDDSLKLILIDANTQQQVTTGPLASAHVKIVLLPGNYNHATMEDGEEEFEKHIVVKLGKKKNLLQGDVHVYLENGSGTVGEIRIQHDKNPIRNVEFRLGAMVVDSCFYDQVKVKQAITQPFKVKDRRNAPKSFRPLLLTDKVWQLENIRKHGPIHNRLERSNVCTIMDFLYMYHSNPQALQQIYRVTGKKWETTVNHAKTCNSGNSPIRLGSTSQLGSNTIPSSFDDGCYVPEPYENDFFGKHEMIVDDNFSINDVEKCDMDICWFHDHEGIGGASTVVKGVKAKKRWMKMRTILFSIVSFMCRCKCNLDR